MATTSSNRRPHQRRRRQGKQREAYCSDPSTPALSSHYEWREYEAKKKKKSPGLINQRDGREGGNSNINVAALPIFRGVGGQSAVVHLSRFSKVCRANNISECEETARRIFPATLDEEAIVWYDREIEPKEGMEWEEVKASFMEEYSGECGRRGELRSELMMIKQGKGESVRSYFRRLEWIIRRWPEGEGVSEDLVRWIFVDGIREDLKVGEKEDDANVREEGGSLEGALAMALQWEKEATGGAAAAVAKCGFCGCKHVEKECIIRKRMKQLWLRSRDRQMSKAAHTTPPPQHHSTSSIM